MTEKNLGGRPAHQATQQNKQMVEALAGFAIPTERIAEVLGITKPTLFKHYADEVRRGGAMVEAKLVGNLLKIASGADGTALRAITFALNCRFGWSAYAPRPETKEEPLGKKEMQEREANHAHEGSEWGNLLQ